MNGVASIPEIKQKRLSWCPTADQARNVANVYGTPTFVYSAEHIKNNLINLKEHLPEKMGVFYSLKANPNVSIVKHLADLGCGAEVSSLAELETAMIAGVNRENIIFLGPAKTDSEMKRCLDIGIFAIVCESIEELVKLESMEDRGRIPVMLRVNPSFTGAGAGLTMSGKARQFGIDESAIIQSAQLISSLKRVDILGFHVYMGTRILEATSIVENSKNILNLALNLAETLQVNLRVVDVGGGLGVPYFDNEEPLDLIALKHGLGVELAKFRKISNARIIMELGRYLVAESGVMLTEVLGVKKSMGEIFAIANGGTNLHMAAVGIGSFVKRNFPVVNLTGAAACMEVCNITGPLCTPNDVLAKKSSIREPHVGDILGILMSGAYGPTASPTAFLSHGFPAEVMVTLTDTQLIRRRETADDLLRNQILIEVTSDVARAS